MATSMYLDARLPAEDNRRIALALLLSALFHTALLLFLSSGAWRMGSLSDTTTPPLRVHIEPPERNDAEDDALRHSEPVVVEERAAPAPEPVNVDALAATESEPDVPEAPPVDDPPAPLEPVFAEAEGEVAPDGLPPAEPELVNEAPTEAVVASIAPAQERVLTRRLAREARKLLDSRAPQRHVVFEHDDRKYAAALTRQPAVDGTGVERVAVEITTEHDGERLQTNMQMKRLAFSHFTQLVDRWDPWVMLHDDKIAGRFHSNSEIVLTYDREVAPRLLGKVTTARHFRITREEGWRPRRKIFVGGIETRAARIGLPAISLPVAHAHATRNADVELIRSDSLIVFHADGRYDCIELASRAEAPRQLPPDRPSYIIGVHDVELRVRGVVNGNVTVYSAARIVIQGDLTYAHTPRTDPDSDDYLGLVSDGNIEIDRPGVTGPGDLEIHGAIYARKRFIVRNIHARRAGTLFVYGSLAAGSISATEPRYATRIEFDPRFERVRPPGFPETNQYEIESWDARWRAAAPANE